MKTDDVQRRVAGFPGSNVGSPSRALKPYITQAGRLWRQKVFCQKKLILINKELFLNDIFET
jgi:hypothetical protein